MQTVRTIEELVDAFGGQREFGRAVWPDSPSRDHGPRGGTARLRGCVPVARWARTIREAKRRGIVVTREQLAAWSEKQAGKQYK